MGILISNRNQEVSFGVYFLASDNVFDHTMAFLNSFRFHNPTIPLCFIPFDENTERVRLMASTYNFAVFDDIKLLLRCDGISAITWGRVMGHFRKIAMWEGMFDRFIYIDIDTLVLRPLEYMFFHLDHYDFVTGTSNIKDSRKFTWKHSMYSANLLTKDQIDYAANTGFIVSKRGVLKLDEAWKTAEDYALLLRTHMYMSMEQPLLNFLVMRSQARCTSFHQLAAMNPQAKIPVEIYAPDPDWSVSSSDVAFYKGKVHSAFMIHWAGQTQPRMPKFGEVILAWGNTVINFLMKLAVPHRKYHRKTWLRYRRMRDSVT